jgi:histidinol phosphatase-like PHP family hydrolase
MVKQAIDKKGVSTVLEEVALFLELKGENPFKVKAYSHAARTIETLEEDPGVMIREGCLKEIKGIGEALAQHITELVTTGRLQLHEELKSSIPPGHLEMLKIPGLGPKKIKVLPDRLSIKTVGELDILPDGSLDYEGSILREFDFVIASVHSHFNMSREEMTQRVIKALRNPHTTILAHPTGRLLLAREPYAIDRVSIIDEASRSGVAIELNAHPYRLDIDWRLCKYAKEKGFKISINPDAHEEAGLKDIYYGVGIGRKGWLEPEDILNAVNSGEMKAFLERRKPG